MKVLFWTSDALIGRLIQFFTGQSLTHVAIFLEGMTWESDQGGAKGTPGERRSWATKTPRRPLTETEKTAIWYYCARAVDRGHWYNYLKIVALAIVYPTRKFWRWLGWVPFDRECMGETCSSFVDEAFKAAGIDLLPGEHEGYTSPGDIWESPFLG